MEIASGLAHTTYLEAYWYVLGVGGGGQEEEIAKWLSSSHMWCKTLKHMSAQVLYTHTQ